MVEYLFFDKYKKIKKLLDKEKNHVQRKYTRNFSQNLQIKLKKSKISQTKYKVSC